MRSQTLIGIDFKTFYFSSNEMWNQEKKSDGRTPRSACFLKCLSRWMEVLPVIIGSVLVGWHLPWSVFIVNPDQWCRHDRGQAWPGSSTPYWDLPHHLPRGGARSESINGLSWSISGASPFPSAPRTLRFTRPRGGRPSRKPLGPNGGWVSHWGKSPALFHCLLLNCAA